jgi:hypothetical protein
MTCPYCSTRFEVDMRGVQPTFKLADNASEAAQGIQIIDPEVPVDYTSTPAEPASQSLTGEVVEPVFRNQTQFRFFGGRVWLIIVVAVVGAFCLSCACMAVIIQRVFIK